MNDLNKKNLYESARQILNELNPLESEILKLSMGFDSNLVEQDIEIASILEIPVQFVEEYRGRALRKLRHPTRADAFKVLTEHEPLKNKKIDIIIAKAVDEIGKLTPELVDHLRTKTDDITKLKPDVFEHLVAELLASRDFKNVKLVGKNSSTSADIFATKFIDDIGEHRYFIEVKRWKDKIGVEVIDRVYGARISEQPKYGWTAAMVVSIVGFKQFRKYSREDIQNMGIYLKNRDDLLIWLNEYKENKNGLFVPIKEY